MARHIRVPGIVDVVLVSDPAEIRALDDQQKIDRNFIPRGPLVNRLIVGRIRRWFEIMGQLLPSLTPRGDQVRADRQKQLAAALDPAHESSQGSPLWTDAQIDSLAAYVRGAGGDEAAAITTQEIVGRLFDTQYRADRATWQAAKMIDQFRDGFSLIQIVWQLTGQLRRARDLLVNRAKDDRWTMHGTAIGVHGIVQALAGMRALRALPTAASFSDDTVLGRCLAPPKRVPRTVEASLETPFVSDSLKAGAIVMLQLETAGPQAPDAEMVFMRDHWNACPARAFVTALLKTVWRRSLQETVVA
jgi:hypothetical protein